MPILHLKYAFNFTDLFTAAGLARLDALFLATLHAKQPQYHDQLLTLRQHPTAFTTVERSTLLMAIAKQLEDFLADFFAIGHQLVKVHDDLIALNPLARFKQHFILRGAKKLLTTSSSLPDFNTLTHWLEQQLATFPIQTTDAELQLALLGNHYLTDPMHFKTAIIQLTQWCAQAMSDPQGRAQTAGWTLFRLPQTLDYQHLVPTQHEPLSVLSHPDPAAIAASTTTLTRHHAKQLRQRDGFTLTDQRMNRRQIQDEVNYCIYCHDHEGDFCSKGFPIKKRQPDAGFRTNPLNTALIGCPLEEKISEAHQLRRDGAIIAALAIIMIDNPMCPATGHRICNDCMKACIYQKQDPVNIPQIETAILSEVLALPWGVEIYDLLTRWNPLATPRWVMQPYNGYKVMIAGMGPAGFTMAHYLLQEGCAVIGFDGLKIEPLPTQLLTQPIYRFSDLYEPLDDRVMAGFGGVAEYGITVRWDKNFLKLIYLSLMRQPHFQVFGNVRLGGTLRIEDAQSLGCDHVVIAVGAGLPKALSLPGSLAPGMRQANDFLMALQLGNAAKSTSLTKLAIRLPAIVIGGGLTGVDTATEIQAYYITQVEKIAFLYEQLLAVYGKHTLHQQLDRSAQDTLEEYLTHAAMIKQERSLAQAEQRRVNFIPLIRQWGGVSIVYRQAMQQSPAYRHNHEELKQALAEGIYYLENTEPVAIQLDDSGHVCGLACRLTTNTNNDPDATFTLPARSILAATGTQPNIAYEYEHRGTFERQHLHYQHYQDIDNQFVPVDIAPHCKTPHFGPFTSYQHNNHRVSLIGDTHPVFHGSVVKAIASAKRSYLHIMQQLRTRTPDTTSYAHFRTTLATYFSAHIVGMMRKTKHIIELVVHAPYATRHFQPGHFYRLQNYDYTTRRIHGTKLTIEPLALIAAECDQQASTLTFIVNEETPSAKLCATLKPNDPIALMGPTGVHAKIPTTPAMVLIIGDSSSLAFVRSYGKALREKNHWVGYMHLYTEANTLYCQNQLEQAAQMIIWVTPHTDCLTPRRELDISLQAMTLTEAFGQLRHRHLPVDLAAVNSIFVIGSTKLLREFQAWQEQLPPAYFYHQPTIIGSVNGNMQCMLKGVCAQCLQWQIDPTTKQRTKTVFACSWQNQPLDCIDITHLEERAQHNELMEQLNQLWVTYLFKQYPLQTV